MDPGQMFYQSAADLAKQLMTLATGITGLSITMQKDVIRSSGRFMRLTLKTSWVLYFFSIVCGFWTLMALTGDLHELMGSGGNPLQAKDNLKIPAGAQIFLFVVATFAIIVFALFAYRPTPTPQPASPPAPRTPRDQDILGRLTAIEIEVRELIKKI